ncbi:hypothetical protein AVEN_192544-1 [Araneus ventricosus]|uniref:Uncharacterized protein n=1 Tax=Araneus ventricosus TaxID=182803 RepID=A0A4Y2FTD7_ARAVE|nr:hypothetical protein AVEN_192544-1 [Araneus ventricosus]
MTSAHHPHGSTQVQFAYMRPGSRKATANSCPENFNPFNIPISLEALKTKKPTDKEQADRDKAAETQRQIEMIFGGAPQWPWE